MQIKSYLKKTERGGEDLWATIRFYARKKCKSALFALRMLMEKEKDRKSRVMYSWTWKRHMTLCEETSCDIV